MIKGQKAILWVTLLIWILIALWLLFFFFIGGRVDNPQSNTIDDGIKIMVSSLEIGGIITVILLAVYYLLGKSKTKDK